MKCVLLVGLLAGGVLAVAQTTGLVPMDRKHKGGSWG